MVVAGGVHLRRRDPERSEPMARGISGAMGVPRSPLNGGRHPDGHGAAAGSG